MPDNPFNFSVPVLPADFINREDIIDTVLNITVTRKSKGDIWLIGARQIGKTSLLQNIEYSYKNKKYKSDIDSLHKNFQVIMIYSNLQKLQSKSEFYNNLTQKLIDKFDFKIDKEDDNYRMFIEWIKELYKRQYYIVFLLDEFDAFLQKLFLRSENDAAQFLDELNVDKAGVQEIENRPKIFSFVFCSNHTLGELTKDRNLHGSGLIVNKIIELPFFTEIQIKNLAQQYLKDTGVRFIDDEIKICYKVTNGYPLFVQMFFSDLFDNRIKEVNDFSAEFYNKIKKQYEETAKKLVIDWHSRKNLPETTINKIKKLFHGLGITIEFLGLKLTFKKDT